MKKERRNKRKIYRTKSGFSMLFLFINPNLKVKMSVHKCIWWSSNLSKCNARKKERNENTISIIFHYILICATKCICNMILHLVFPGLHNVFLSLTPFLSFVHCALHRIIFYMPSVNFLECFCSRYCKFVFVFLLKKKKNTKIYFDFFTSNCISMWFKYKRIHVCVCVCGARKEN